MKKLFVLLLCFNIVLAPTYVFANPSLGGWTITQQIAQGSSLALEATKNTIINGSTVIQNSTAKIKPTVGAVSKVLARGAAGYALSVAVEQLLGSVDWVLDPANNQIKYWDTDTSLPNNCSSSYLLNYESQNLTTSQVISKIKSNIENRSPSAFAQDYNGIISISCTATTVTIVVDVIWCQTNCAPAPVYTYGGKPSSQTHTATIVGNVEKDEPKTLPLSTVAAQVISNADSHPDQDKKVGAQAATTQAAQDMLANDSSTQSNVETQLNANASTQTSEQATGNTKPNEANPEITDITLSFPAFCGWAPTVCQAANVVINFPTTLTNWWNTATQAISASWLSFKEWLDWTKNDSELPDNQTNEVSELPIPELQENAISWTASCPPDVQVPINLYGQSSTLTFSWSPWCQLLNIIKPAIIASAYIGAAFIVLGLRT
ncbi:hypothetical protein HMPREF0026_01006 [Acinetobacter junii SH205]|uniref:Uncharacterized protein n=1 Tax=Acinetobacter junii SH205 TaxID=575587 RepID=D0SIQ8_ACIJU|nr:virulence factor TspB C-terminal domain-related protein [Acinetobacter junii]EEY93730.1 hypothetical protein HMPREF0026_01006 [Acinetobacter junii SH205]